MWISGTRVNGGPGVDARAKLELGSKGLQYESRAIIVIIQQHLKKLNCICSCRPNGGGGRSIPCSGVVRLPRGRPLFNIQAFHPPPTAVNGQ